MKSAIVAAILIVTGLGVSPMLAAEHGRENEGLSKNKQAPGGAWGERSYQGGSAHHNSNQPEPGQERGEHNEGSKGQPSQNLSAEGKPSGP